ncbi:hypothetical protein HAX54_025789 [Datura stramonium]|uniref:Uncharacterized protein n=1 Tax=Datura stramonium TaxID=4076 RepID=A0ABS8S6H7_DATST|nr:hypothetical protein [Datura stramonium]
MKEIKDILKCLVEKYDEKQLQLEMQGATIRNLEQINIVDSNQDEREFEKELEVLTREFRVEHQQPNQLEFEDADVEEVILESIKDIEDIHLADSSATDVEDIESSEIHVYEHTGPHSKYFSTLCTDGE